MPKHTSTDSERPAIWIVMQNPSQMVTAVGLSLYYRSTYQVNLVFSRFHYWDWVDFSVINGYFDKIIDCPNISISRNLIKQAYRSLISKRKIRTMGVGERDVFISLTSTSCLEGIIYYLYKKQKKILIFPTIKALSAVAQSDSYTEWIYSKIWNIFFLPLIGSLPIACYKSTRDIKMEDVYLYKQGEANIFSTCLTLIDINAPQLNNSELCDFSFFVKNNLSKTTVVDKPCVLFFGECRSAENALPEDIAFTNQCLRYIERFFPDRTLIYKPHPNDRFETTNIELGKFIVSTEKMNAQILLLKNMASIEACFTIASTAVRSCINMGISQSYFFLKMQPGPRGDQYNIALSVLGDTVDPRAFIQSFATPPEKYEVLYNQELFDKGMAQLTQYLLY